MAVKWVKLKKLLKTLYPYLVMNQLYQQQLMDHYHNPRNQGTLDNADFKSGVLNPSCGDSVAMAGIVENRRLIIVMFQGSGCVISQATASLLTENVKGKLIDDIMVLDRHWIAQLIGMELGPVRLKCALLPLQALQEGIVHYQKIKE